MRETFISPSMLRVCCACGLIQDESGATPDLERWISHRTYREAHGVNPAELELTHTYCPTCFAKVEEVVRQFSKRPDRRHDPLCSLELCHSTRCKRPM